MAKEKTHYPYALAIATFADGTTIRRTIGQPIGKPIDRKAVSEAFRFSYRLLSLQSKVRYAAQATCRLGGEGELLERCEPDADGVRAEVRWTPIRWERTYWPAELESFVKDGFRALKPGPEPVKLEILREQAVKPKAKTKAVAYVMPADLVAFMGELRERLQWHASVNGCERDYEMIARLTAIQAQESSNAKN